MGRLSAGEASNPYELRQGLAELTEFAIVTLDVQAIMERAVAVVAQSLLVEHVIATEVCATPANLCLRAGMGWHQDSIGQIARSICGCAAGSGPSAPGEVVVLKPADADGTRCADPRLMLRYGLVTSRVVPIPGPGEPFGVLGVFSCSTRSFDGEDLRFLRAVASILGLAIARTQSEDARAVNVDKVLRAKHELQASVDAVPQLVCLIDESGAIIRTNRAIESWRLGTADAARGMPVHELFHPGCSRTDCEFHRHWLRGLEAMRRGQASEWELYDATLARDLRLSLRKSAELRDWNSMAEGGWGVLMLEDISERKRAERALEEYNEELQRAVKERTQQLTLANSQLRREIEEHKRNKLALLESEQRYGTLVENTLIGIYITPGEKLVFCNKRFAEIFGYDRDELCSMELSQLFDGEEYAVAADGLPVVLGDQDLPCERIVRGITSRGEIVWLKRRVSHIEISEQSLMLGNVIDITDQIRGETTLRQSEHKLRLLSSQLLSAQETERKRIASELHDGVGQSLVAIKFSVENAIKEFELSVPEGQLARLRGVVRKVQDAIEEVRNISMDLRPSTLDDLGIVATIHWFCREFHAVFPLRQFVKSISVEEDEVPESLKVVIFRILQEALNNVAKHAKASSVYVNLGVVDEQLQLSVSDNGCGFAPEEKEASARGFGLNSMRERAMLSGGRLLIHSAPGRGTTIEVLWPLA